MTAGLAVSEKCMYGEFLAIRDRAEYIEGEVRMMASPTELHDLVGGKLYAQLDVKLGGKRCQAYIAPMDVTFFLDEQEEEKAFSGERVRVYQPDVFVLCDPAKSTGAFIKGAPDFILEVLSPSTASIDRVEKFDFYERYGVREYWMLDPTNRNLIIATPDETGRYATRSLDARGLVRIGVLGLAVDFDLVYGSLLFVNRIERP